MFEISECYFVYGKLQWKATQGLGVYEQRHIIRLENNMPFEEQLLACYQTLVDGASDHRALRHSGLLIMTLVLSNPPSHKVGQETPSQPVKMKLWAVLCRATKDVQVMVESSDTHTQKQTHFWQHVVHWRREWQTTPVFLPWEPHEQYEKAKRYDTWRWPPQVCRCPIC